MQILNGDKLGDDDLQNILYRMRLAQRLWHEKGVRFRARKLSPLASQLAMHASELAGAVNRSAADRAEILASEVLPLAEACRFNSKSVVSALSPLKLSRRGAAWWMGSISITQAYDPLGVVLIIAPGNYPLFIAGAQIVQALLAGNAVCIKPAPGNSAVIELLRRLCVACGVPEELITVLPEDPKAAQQVMQLGIDKVFFTGSSATGREILHRSVEHLTPCALELSGNDAVLILDDADLDRAISCIVYSLTLNGGQTCIGPRRLFATNATMAAVKDRLREHSDLSHSFEVNPKAIAAARQAVEKALQSGAELIVGNLNCLENPKQVQPIVLSSVKPTDEIANSDLFVPILSLIEVNTIPQAIDAVNSCHYALGASVFGVTSQAQMVADQLHVGCVTVNDVLVPTADPRVAFGGRGESGFGVTRGVEGLKEMTRLKVVCERRGKWLPHLDPKTPELENMLSGILLMRHGSRLQDRWRGLKQLITKRKTKSE